MVVLTIRDVPDDVRDALAQDARERGQSLQAFLLGVLKRQAGFNHNRQLLVDVERELAADGGVGADAPDAAEVLARARDDRDGANAPGKRGAGGAA